ncbi:integrase core domain-containing protein [Acidimicrobium ferrooxidans]|uniref:integrase core domain-containing protein n=1 Tax=Acidimicrobium ferrooxidans TaxID=53635 RepID=UPI003CCB2A01
MAPTSTSPGRFASSARRSGFASRWAGSRPRDDNAVAEAFFGSLKRELVGRYRFANLAEARPAIASWIQRYNTVRLHSSLGYRPPIEYELTWARAEAAVAYIQTVKQMGGRPAIWTH